MAIPSKFGDYYKSQLPTINFLGTTSTSSSKTNWGEVAIGTLLGLGGTIATTALAAKQASGTSGGGEVSAEQQAQQQQQVQQQQLYNEVVGYARDMDASAIQSKISEIDGNITNLQAELAEQQELALGEQSQAYKDNETKMKDMEEKYGFGAGTPGKDSTQEAKQGDAYQKAYDKYNTLLEQDTNQKAKASQLEGQLSNVSSQIQNVGTSIANAEGELTKLNASLSSAQNDAQKKNIQNQITFKETELNNLKQQKNTLEQNKIKLEGEQSKNNQAAVKQEDIERAKAEMDAAASPNGAEGANFESEYKTYLGLKDANKKLKAGVSVAQREVQRIELEIKSKELEQAKYKDALQIKEKITTDDAKAMDNFDDVSASDGNWFTRTFGWGKKGKAQREARADRNDYIEQYMANHGVSKKEAKEALENLSGMNSDNNEQVTTVPESTPSYNISATKTHTTNFGTGVDVSDVTNEFIMKNIVTNPQINSVNVNLAVIEYTTQNPNADKNDILEMLNQKFNINSF